MPIESTEERGIEFSGFAEPFSRSSIFTLIEHAMQLPGALLRNWHSTKDPLFRAGVADIQAQIDNLIKRLEAA